MSKFGNVQMVTDSVGGKLCNFRSKLEYRWALWCEFRKQHGIITDWWHEDPESIMEYEVEHTKYTAVKNYIPDFTIQIGDDFEYEETKGHFTAKDAKKLKKIAQKYDNPLILIFANLKNTPSRRAQFNRAKKIEPYLKRIIYDAEKTIFKKIGI